jgi:fructose-1,6-bisphosphatase I
MEVHSERKPFVTLQQHIMQQQRKFVTATGDFSLLLSGISLATKAISAAVRRAGINDIIGTTGTTNVQGELVQKLDQFADETIIRSLDYRQVVSTIASEENEQAMFIHDSPEGGKYIVIFDPLDGSSNIDVNITVGTIFSILSQPQANQKNSEVDILQEGTRQLGAGYVVYGPSTEMVYTTGHGVHMFTMDPDIGTYVLCDESLQIPGDSKIYSINEGNYESFPERIKKWLEWMKVDQAGKYKARYVGSLVADFHRTLLKGGVFAYPETKSNPEGKLRLLYEANPMAFLAEQAGGKATDGQGQRIMEIVPKSLHQRTSLVVGSQEEVDLLESF